MNEVAYVHGTYVKDSYPEARYNVKEFEHRTNLNLYDELIFSAKDLSAHQIIHWMTTIKSTHLDFKNLGEIKDSSREINVLFS